MTTAMRFLSDTVLGNESSRSRPDTPEKHELLPATAFTDPSPLLGSGSEADSASLLPEVLFLPKKNLKNSRSGGCCGVQRTLRRFFRRTGFGMYFYWFKVSLALAGTTLLWVGIWNLAEYDCFLTPDAVSCNRTLWRENHNMTSHHNLTAVVEGQHLLGVSNPFDYKLPRWLLGDNAGMFRAELTMVIGWVLMMMSDTMYCHVGFEAALIPAFHRDELKGTWGGRLLTLVRSLMGLVGQPMLWGGMMTWQYDIVDRWSFCHVYDHCVNDYAVHATVFVVGIVIVVATGSWEGTTFLFNEDDDGSPNPLQSMFGMHNAKDETKMTSCDQVRYTIRSTLSVFGQSLLWLASGNAMDMTINRYTRQEHAGWRSMAYLWIGLALMSMTNSIDANAWIEQEDYNLGESVDDDVLEYDSEEEDDEDGDSECEGPAPVFMPIAGFNTSVQNVGGEADPVSSGIDIDFSDADSDGSSGGAGKIRHGTFKFYVTSFVSLVGQLIFVYGYWDMLDLHWVGTGNMGAEPGTWLPYKSTEANLMMAAIGVGFTMMGGTYLSNAALTVIPVHSSAWTGGSERVQAALDDLEKTMAKDKDHSTQTAHKIGQLRAMATVVPRRRRAHSHVLVLPPTVKRERFGLAPAHARGRASSLSSLARTRHYE